jgi:two-component system, response regulator
MVLYIEDDPDDIFLVQHASKRVGLRDAIVALNSGIAALEMMSSGDSEGLRQRTAMILLDLNMPGVNGFQVLDALRVQEGWSRVPVVVFTCSENPRDMKEAYERGANAYVVKPRVLDELPDLLSSAYRFARRLGGSCG